MLYENTILKDLHQAFTIMKSMSVIERLQLYKNMAAFYNNDFIEIKRVLKETLSTQFSKETLDGKLIYQHINFLKKAIRRVTGGIYSNEPTRELNKGENKAWDGLSGILQSLKYQQKVKDAFRKAVYYNIVAIQPVYDEELKKMRLDVITPDCFGVTTETDYLIAKEFYRQIARPDGTVYTSVWTKDKHFIVDGVLEAGLITKSPAKSNQQNVNPYKELPQVILRIDEGMNFYGEPNWNLYLNQKSMDIRKTTFFLTELKQQFGIFFGVNTQFDKDEKFNAGEFKQVNNVKTDDKDPLLECIVPDVKWDELRNNQDHDIKTVLMTEGLPASSSSTESKDLSGKAKTIDEIELHEAREDMKGILYDFEIELLNKIRLVWNTHMKGDKIPEGDFEVTFIDEQPAESIDDKIKRRDAENYKDLVDFVMEDLEYNEQQAIEYLTARKERYEKNQDLLDFFDKTPEALQQPIQTNQPNQPI